MYERRWLVIPTNITGSINFSEVIETGIESLRISNDGSETFVKYDVLYRENDEIKTFWNAETQQEQTVILPPILSGRPSFYSSSYNEYNYNEILELLETSKWRKDPDS